jgi:hypothetical protein
MGVDTVFAVHELFKKLFPLSKAISEKDIRRNEFLAAYDRKRTHCNSFYNRFSLFPELFN